MKFSVEIETDSQTFESPSRGCPSPSPLQWNIEVEVKQKVVEQPAPAQKVVQQPTAVQKVVEQPTPVQKVVQLPPPQPRGAQPTPQAKENQPKGHGAISISHKKSVVIDNKAAGASDILRKLSALSARGRKVSRQGEWIIVSERVGLLTSQNGVQQVRERRVKLGSTDLDKLVELGY